MNFKKIITSVALVLATGAASLSAAVNLPAIHQDGKYLKDEAGNVVNLHGVMDTPNAYFNGNRWALDWGGGKYNSQTSLNNCLNYFNKMLPGLNNRTKGSYCNLFRLHLDPAWTNDPNKTSTGENDISAFSSSRLSTYMDKLYWPIAMKALEGGMYVIMRPPGVCPQQISVNGAYQNYLLTVWDIVSKSIVSKGLSGQVMIELANEPIQILNQYGQRTDNAPRDFFQPIINKIRQNGYTGVILVPGEGYQSQYTKYSTYGISDNNYGYAVHYYPGWYGTHDNWYAPNTTLANFKAQVPVVDQRPIIVTEIDWSPEKRDANGNKVIDHYNEFGQAVYKNYGTWGTATTSNWGNEFKFVHDQLGNVSMTIEGSGLYLDIDAYLNNGTVQPAFMNEAQPGEACAKPCFDWYKEWNNFTPQFAQTSSSSSGSSSSSSSSTTYVDESYGLFRLDNGSFNPQIYGTGWCNWVPAQGFLSFAASQYGFGGWQNANGFDVSQYESITVTLAEARTGDVSLRVFTENNYWNNNACIIAKFNGTKTATIDLSNINRLYIVGFWDYGNTDLNAATNKVRPTKITLKKKAQAVQAYNTDWDFAPYTSTVILSGANYKTNYSGLTLVGNSSSTYTKDFVSKSGFHCNGPSSSANRYITFTPAANGTLKLYFRSNNSSDKNRYAAIGTAIGTPIATANCWAGEVAANVQAGKTYYLYIVSGGMTFTRVEYRPYVSLANVRGNYDDTTGIDGVEAEETEAEEPIYTLSGRRIHDTENLPTGIYIRGGKKIMIR